MKLSIIIVNWNSCNLTQKCIEKIQENVFNQGVEIIVIDNASDIFDEFKFKRHPYNVIIHKNKTNIGFGKACNFGAQLAKGEFLLFLNPDVEINKDTLLKSISIFESNERELRLGALGIQLTDGDGVQKTCATFPNTWNIICETLRLNKINPFFFKGIRDENFDHCSSQLVDHVIGAFYLIKKSLFEELKGFDPEYFVYYEDLDLSNRLKRTGKKILYTTKISAKHIGGGSTKSLGYSRNYISIDAKEVYVRKNIAPNCLFNIIIKLCFKVERLLIKIFIKKNNRLRPSS